jgi:hypothetical protein
LQEGRENANIDAGLGFLWKISVERIVQKNVPAAPLTSEVADFCFLQ